MTFKVMGQTKDRRTNAHVLYCKCSITEYLSLVGDEFEDYSIQRKRESHKAYKRLKDDLKQGALLPSITLALKPHLVRKVRALIDDEVPLESVVNKKNQADILDGLQRTYLIKELASEGHHFSDEQEVLIEYWIEDDISKLIYRMIVLNAGQKTMSMRHQIELLFISLKGIIAEEIDGVEIYLEKDLARRTAPHKYALGDIAAAYHAFLTRSTEIDKNNMVSDALVKDTVMDASEEEHTRKFDQFLKYFKKVKSLDELAWRHYSSLFQEQLLEHLSSKDSLETDEVEQLKKQRVFKTAKNWLGSQNVMLALYSSISRLLNTGREDRVDDGLGRLEEAFNSKSEDPLGLVQYENLKAEINPKKSNVGHATRKLLTNGFKEYFRDAGETPFANCWEEAKD